jgi:hypothetical protein
MPHKTQDDIVRESQGFQPKFFTDKIVVPGIENLHTKPTTDIAEVITNVLRSRPNITQLVYVVGSHFEVTSET